MRPVGERTGACRTATSAEPWMARPDFGCGAGCVADKVRPPTSEHRAPSTDLEGMDARKASLRGGLLLGYLFLATQEKVTRAKRENLVVPDGTMHPIGCQLLIFVVTKPEDEERKTKINGGGASPALQRLKEKRAGQAPHLQRQEASKLNGACLDACSVRRLRRSRPSHRRASSRTARECSSMPVLTTPLRLPARVPRWPQQGPR
jgi:hypothetical protein